MIARIALVATVLAMGLLAAPAVADLGFEIAEDAEAAQNVCYGATCSPNTPVGYWCRLGLSPKCGNS